MCYLVCDESKDVSMPAQDFLGFLFLSDGKYTVVDDLAEIFNRSILFALNKLDCIYDVYPKIFTLSFLFA